MDTINMETLILDYAVRHKCWKTFDVLYREKVKLQIDRTALTLFAIQRVIHEDCVEKFEVSIALLQRIYGQQLARCGYEVYWQLMVGLRLKVFLYSLNHEPEEKYLNKLKMLLTGESIILSWEDKEEIQKVKEKLWKLSRTFLSFVSNPARPDTIADNEEILSTTELCRYIDLFASSVLEHMPPCDLDLVLKGLHQSASVKYPCEKILNNFIKTKCSLADDHLIDFLDEIHGEHKEKQASNPNTNDVVTLAYLKDDRTSMQEASQLWDRQDLFEDGCSIVSPSVSDDSTEVQLSDLEREELIFKDSEIVKTPDLGAFVTAYLNVERI